MSKTLAFLSYNSVHFGTYSHRFFSHKVAKLTDKRLINVKGPDAPKFLQGLITNDINHLYPDSTGVHRRCIYAFALNSKGRVFADIFVYNLRQSVSDSNHHLLLECDGLVADRLINHLKIHKIRTKVEISVNNTFNIYTIFPQGDNFDNVFSQIDDDILKIEGLVTDPRIPGHYRCLSPSLESFSTLEFTEPNEYTIHRFKLGIGEGCVDHPEDSCFPLECNGDYLHGISFLKGCYIGQELTARTYHTGVIRKRLMPIELSKAIKKSNIKDNITIKVGDNKVGKYRSSLGLNGLGLLYKDKIDYSMVGYLDVDGEIINVYFRKPKWWPKESKMEK